MSAWTLNRALTVDQTVTYRIQTNAYCSHMQGGPGRCGNTEPRP